MGIVISFTRKSAASGALKLGSRPCRKEAVVAPEFWVFRSMRVSGAFSVWRYVEAECAFQEFVPWESGWVDLGLNPLTVMSDREPIRTMDAGEVARIFAASDCPNDLHTARVFEALACAPGRWEFAHSRRPYYPLPR